MNANEVLKMLEPNWIVRSDYEELLRAHAAALEENAKLAARVLVLEKIIGLNVLLAARSK